MKSVAFKLDVQSWIFFFMTRKSGHIWRNLAWNDPKIHAQINVAQIHLPGWHSAKTRQILPTNFAEFPPKIRQNLQGVFVKIGDFTELKGSLVEFLENRLSSENQKPPKIAGKVDFSEPRP